VRLSAVMKVEDEDADLASMPGADTEAELEAANGTSAGTNSQKYSKQNDVCMVLKNTLILYNDLIR
jgi:hypothetical protein